MEDVPPSLWLFGAAAVLLAIQAAFVAAEVSFLSLGVVRARRLVAEGRRGARLLSWMLADRGRLFSTVLISITTLGYAAESLVTYASPLVHPVYGHYICLAVVVGISIVFVEAMPVIVASKAPEKLALALAPVSVLAYWALWLFVTVLSLIANGFLRLTGAIDRASPRMTEDEMRSLIDVAEVDEDEKSMLRRVLEFGDRTVQEVMVPRTDMVCVEDTATAERAVGLMVEHGYSRLPVYHERRDNVVGVLYSKDVLPLLAEGRRGDAVAPVMRAPLFIHEKRRVQDLVVEFQRQRRAMALVNDEYGGIAGMVTLEDAMEELVGEIFDEYDVEETGTESIDENTYRIRGSQGIHEVMRELGVELPEGDYETISGLISSNLGHLPEPGECVELENGIRIEVLEVDQRRVRTARLLMPFADAVPLGRTDNE